MYSAEEAVGWVDWNQGKFGKIEQDNCFNIQHVDTKAQFLFTAKKLETIFILPFFSPTHEIAYIAGYLLTTEGKNSVHHDYIWAVLFQCVE